ncbi:hypothetical protein DPMN_088821 [Dreissena polymorpha]|uniref:Uncharacterized protein n=1 Tax=Dreissena polymorpha TaxID=45954 RepID=A0A9D4KVL8_DREPO|nr:hypothetical protein DPMN_088821 [Dreissena polymorpha]
MWKLFQKCVRNSEKAAELVQSFSVEAYVLTGKYERPMSIFLSLEIESKELNFPPKALNPAKTLICVLLMYPFDRQDALPELTASGKP